MTVSTTYTFTFESTQFDPSTFSVGRFRAEEAISELYTFTIDLVAPVDTRVEELIAAEATFTFASRDNERQVHGTVSDVETLTATAEHALCRIRLVPQVWSLTRTPAYSVHLDSRPREIIHAVFQHAQLTELDYRIHSDEDQYRKPFRMQYGETHWDFLSRALEREGICYYFVHEDDHETVVFCDNASAHPTITGPAEVPFEPAAGSYAEDAGEAVYTLMSRHRQQPREVHLRNYNDCRPSQKISATATVDADSIGTVELFGDNLDDQTEAERLVAIRAEELACARTVHHGESTVCTLAPGHRFQLTGHPHTERYNGEYLLLSVEHQGVDPAALDLVDQRPAEAAAASTYSNRFTAIDGKQQYRPPRETIKPRIHGTVTAHIDADNGNFPEIDHEGRYRIRFPFYDAATVADEEAPRERASHRVRLMQPYGGEVEGMHFPLRNGTRVLVTFMGGDPDLPVISGVLPSSEQFHPTTEHNVNKSNINTPSGNKIELDDQNSRVKMESSTKKTYFHLGASNHPGDGIVATTDGTSVWQAFGGYNFVFSTYNWVVDTDFWPLSTADERRRDLSSGKLPIDAIGDVIENKDGNLPEKKNDEGEEDDEGVVNWSDVISEWDEEVPDSLFAFPRKHKWRDAIRESNDGSNVTLGDLNIDINNDNDRDDLLWDHEISGFVMTNRAIGDLYNYRNGVDFSFVAPQREAFTFGGSASFTTWSYDADPQELRDAGKLVVEQFATENLADIEFDDSDVENVYDEYDTARKKRILRELVTIWGQGRDDLVETFSSGSSREGIRNTVSAIADELESEHDIMDAINSDIESVYAGLAYRRKVSQRLYTVMKNAHDLIGDEDFPSDGWSKGDLSIAVELDTRREGNKYHLDHAGDGRLITSDSSNDSTTNRESFLEELRSTPEFYHEFFIDEFSDNEQGMSLDGEVDSLEQSVKDYIVALNDDFQDAREIYLDNLGDFSRALNAGARERILYGSISVTDLDSLSVTRGNSYSYSIGSSYSESYTHSCEVPDPADREPYANSDLGESNKALGIHEAFDDLLGKGRDDWDLADAPGPAWQKIGIGGLGLSDVGGDIGDEWGDESGNDDPLIALDDPTGQEIFSRESSTVGVTKSFGHAYSFSRGHKVAVTVGDSYNVTYKGYTYSEERTPDDTRVSEAAWKPGHEQTRTYNTVTGDLFSIADKRWDDPSGQRTHTVTMAGTGDITVNLSAKGTITTNVGIISNVTLNVGSVTDCNVNLINKNSVEMVIAGKIDATFGPAWICELKNTTYELTLPGFKSSGKTNSNSLTMNEIQQGLTNIVTRQTELGTGTASAKSIAVAIENGLNMKA